MTKTVRYPVLYDELGHFGCNLLETVNVEDAVTFGYWIWNAAKWNGKPPPFIYLSMG